MILYGKVCFVVAKHACSMDELSWLPRNQMPNQIWKALTNMNRGAEIFLCMAECSDWADISTAYLGLHRLQYPFLLRLRSGEHIRLQELTDLKAFWQIFLRRVYRVRRSDRIILDLGANIGMFTLYAAGIASQARIFSYEPFPSTFDRLLATVRDHQLETRVTCLNYAVTGVSGTRVMADAAVPSQRRALTPASSSKSGTQVLGKTLEAIFEENNLHRVDLLKIDVEGSEYEILLSTPPSLLARISRIAMEYHGDSLPFSKKQLFEHLCDSGFAVSWDTCDKLGYGVTELILRN
jgi:FkbM family methyltransferase